MRLLFISMAILMAQSGFAQSVIPLDANSEWVNGEVLVRFSDQINVKVDKATRKVSNTSIRPAFMGVIIEEVEQLFPFQKSAPDGQSGFYTIGGQWIQYPKLTNIYRFKIIDSTGSQIFNFIKALTDLGGDYVVYAEPNYVSAIHGSYEPNDTLYAQQWNLEAIQADTVQARMLADSTVTDTNTVIAIIDTGVDKDHLDLRNKMWVNEAELNGLPNVDDDQNGFIDDKYGWDFVNNDGNPMDDNNHGTHCAGIAAAETNNGIGIAGVSPGSKIMAVKVMQSGGYGASADIAQGILYAANNGADIISMSIGGTAPSQVTYDALAVAYAYSFLVASAGNSSLCIGKPSPPDYKCPDGKTPKQNYPAAWSFVLGVESSAPTGGKSGFSNYDEDGPITSAWPNLLNYEVRAPGSQIVSTIVAGNTGNNNRYKVQQGTSMACPAVAGGVALLKAFRPTFTHEKVFLYLIKTQTNNIQLNDAIDFVLPPELMYVTNEVVDTLGGDQDGKPDAGEIVELVVSLKNTGGYNNSIWAKIELDSLEDPSLVTFINPVSHFGSASEYAVVQNNFPDSGYHPLKFQLDSNIANSRGVKFVLTMWTADSTFLGTKNFELTVQNGIEFQAGFYPGKTVLYPNAYYLFSGNTVFDTLVIKPGTTVYVESGRSIGGKMITAIGTPDSMISITGVRGAYWNGLTDMDSYDIDFIDGNYQLISNSIIRYTRLEYLFIIPQGFYEISNAHFNYTWEGTPYVVSYNASSKRTKQFLRKTYTNGKKLIEVVHYPQGTFIWKNNLIENNKIFGSTLGYNNFGSTLLGVNSFSVSWNGDTTKNVHIPLISDLSEVWGSNLYANSIGLNNPTYQYGRHYVHSALPDYANTVILNNFNGNDRVTRVPSVGLEGNNTQTITPSRLYIGGKSAAFISFNVHDYFDLSTKPILNASSLLLNAPTGVHGFVVDIKVNEKSIHWLDNPYNGPQGVGILGNSTHKFEVVFNRPMNIAKEPLLTFGIREPWTQNIVADSSSWSADSTVYTAYTTITPLTQSDGINRVSVRLAEDNEHFPCPTENVRFEMRIASTGSLSADFEAVGDTGAINLSWGIPDEAVDDFLGTNMYRLDSVNLQNSVFLYNKMSIDSALVDSTVQAGKWYGYYFKVVRTNLTEMNSSDTVWARPWQGKPSVTTLGATNVTHNAVTLRGRGNPNYLATQVRFNYGLTNSYTTNTTFQNIGNGSAGVLKTVNLSGLTPGTTYYYRIEGTNAEGTSYGHDSTFTTKAFPTLNFRYDSTLCLMDTLKITNNTTISTGSMNYAWEVRNNGSLVYTSSLEEPAFYLNQAGSYTVKLTVSSDQAVTTSKTGILTVDPIPSPTVTASGSVNLCQGGTVTLSAPSGYTYLWNTGETTQSIVVSASGSYSVEVTNANGCSGISPAQNVVVNALPSAVVTTANSAASFCTGSSLTLNTPSGMTGYQWMLNGTSIPGATSASYTAAAAGSYTVLLTNASGCTSLSAGYTVTENALPTAAVSALSSTTFCQGDSVVLSAPAGYTYLWSNGATTQTISTSSAGTYSVVVTNGSGCSVTSSPVTVTVNYIPAMSVSNTGALSFCTGGSTTLTAAGGFASYLWSNGATTQSIIVNSAGSYTVTGYTSAGCSAQSGAALVTVNALPVATVTASGTTTLCQGDSVVLSAPAGYSYAWSNGATTQSITVTQAGNYTVQVANASGCQATSAATAVTVNALPVATIMASGSTTLCTGEQITLTAPAGNSYAWSNGATTQSITVTQAGNYTVQVTNASGCQATSAPTTVTVNALPVATVTANGPTSFCPGDSVQLSAAAPQGNIVWNTGSTASSIWVKAAGTYSVTVTDGGCSAVSNTVSVSQLPQPTTPTVYYSNNANLLISSAPQGNQWILNGADIPGADSTTWYPTQNGLYSVRVTNASGCISESDVFNYVNIGTGEAALKAVSIYPNPTTGISTIELPESEAVIRVYDGIGRLILEGQSSELRYQIDLTRFASGVYRVSVQWQDGTETISLIKH